MKALHPLDRGAGYTGGALTAAQLTAYPRAAGKRYAEPPRERLTADEWTRWVYLSRRQLSRAEVRIYLRAYLAAYPPYTVPGIWRSKVRVRRVGSRILITQHGGYDDSP